MTTDLEGLKSAAERQPFEHFPALASWIERLASTGGGLSLGEWMIFLGALNNALASRARLAEERDELIADNNSLRDRALERTIAAQAAETALSELRREVGEVLGPFAAIGRRLDPKLADHDMVYNFGDGRDRDLEMLAADFRRAAQLHASVQEGHGPSSAPSPTTSRARADGGEAAPRMPRFCPACQAIPKHGYCRLKGCPTAPAEGEK